MNNVISVIVYYAAGLVRIGVFSVGLNAMLWNCTCCDILFEIPRENAEICSWMYIRKVLVLQRPIFLMVVSGTLARCMAMAPPLRKLWLATALGGRPILSRSKAFTAVRTAAVIR